MKYRRVILDTGVLVAFVRKQDRYHSWAIEIWQDITPPMLTSESVLSEVFFLLNKEALGQEAVFDMLRNGVIDVPFCFKQEVTNIHSLINRYSSVPMSFADACLVRMSEIVVGSSVITLDNDFRVYRKNRNQEIPTIMPDVT